MIAAGRAVRVDRQPGRQFIRIVDNFLHRFRSFWLPLALPPFLTGNGALDDRFQKRKGVDQSLALGKTRDLVLSPDAFRNFRTGVTYRHGRSQLQLRLALR